MPQTRKRDLKSLIKSDQKRGAGDAAYCSARHNLKQDQPSLFDGGRGPNYTKTICSLKSSTLFKEKKLKKIRTQLNALYGSSVISLDFAQKIMFCKISECTFKVSFDRITSGEETRFKIKKAVVYHCLFSHRKP